MPDRLCITLCSCRRHWQTDLEEPACDDTSHMRRHLVQIADNVFLDCSPVDHPEHPEAQL